MEENAEEYPTLDDILEDAEYRYEFNKKVKEAIEIEKMKWNKEKEEELDIKKMKEVMDLK